MKNTIISVNSAIENYQKNWYCYLLIEKMRVVDNFNWLHLKIHKQALVGSGNLKIGNVTYQIALSYSPFNEYRFDRIYVTNQNITYNKAIHVYGDLSLCLYHPIIDNPEGKIIPLVRMVPWISEWCVHFSEWRKYGVWLGREITH